MSTITNVFVPAIDVIAIPGNNVRHSVLFTDLDNLIDLSVKMVPGWKAGTGIDWPVVQEIGDTKFDVVAIRSAAKTYLMDFFSESTSVKVKYTKADGTESDSKVELIAKDIEIAFDLTFPMTKKGYPMPKYERVTGNRRSYAMVVANAIRTRLGMNVYTEVPVEIHPKMSELERWMTAARENDAKETALKMNEMDYLYLVSKVFSLSGMYEYKFQMECCGESKRATAQKVWAIARLDHLLPERNLIESMLAGEIPFSPISKEEARHLADAIERKPVGKGKDKIVPPMPTEEDIDKVLMPIKENAPKMAKKTLIEGAFSASTVDGVVLCMGAIIDNDMERLNLLLPFAHKLNECLAECGIKVSRIKGVKPTVDMEKFKAAEAEVIRLREERIRAKIAEREAKEEAEAAARRERMSKES